jgi:gluconolactonase
MPPVPRTVEPADLRVIATGLRFPEGPVALDDGSVLLVEIARGTLSRVAPSGDVEVVAECGGGPNGCALGADGAAYVTNNGGCFTWGERMGLTFPGPPPDEYPGHGALQHVDLDTGTVTDLYEACDGNPLRAPNDLVIDAAGGIWLTDHGVRTERASDRTGAYYAAPDGSSIAEVARPLEAPNGIGLSPSGDRLYVAETHTGRLWAWDVDGPGRLSGPNPMGPGGATLLADPGDFTLFDSLAVDAAGWVCVATLVRGGITCVSPDGSVVEHVPLPDPLTTNICFSADGTTAFATLSGTGQLVSFRWHDH